MHLSKGLEKLKNFANITGMKKTKSYKFKEVDLGSLRELALKVKNPTGFRLEPFNH